MAVVKVMPESYGLNSDLDNVIRYVTNPEKTRGVIGGCMVDPHNAENMIWQMKRIKILYGKQTGYRQLRHIIVSFSPSERLTPQILYLMAWDIAQYYADRYQICFGVHFNTDDPHIHFVQNTVNYKTGKLYSDGLMDLYDLKAHVSHVEWTYLTTEEEKMAEMLGEV